MVMVQRHRGDLEMSQWRWHSDDELDDSLEKHQRGFGGDGDAVVGDMVVAQR